MTVGYALENGIIKNEDLDRLRPGTNRKISYLKSKGLFYLDEIEAIKKKLPRFEFVPVLSAPRPEENWQGKTGFVTEVGEAVDQLIRGGYVESDDFGR